MTQERAYMSTVINLLNQIKQEEVVLPAIQRDFVWPQDKVLRLLDSVMRGYPIGIALLWETYLDIQYRQFSEAFHPGRIHDFKDNKKKKKTEGGAGWAAADPVSRYSALWLL
jgi:uncharacterized protein with ParB-like and HNH nuclease domain